MKKYLVSLALLIVQNICAMELEIARDKKASDIEKLLVKHSRKKNQKRRIDLLPIYIHTTLPFDLQNDIFTTMHQMYEVQKERFITARICWFIDDINRKNKDQWFMRVRLEDNCELFMKTDLCLLFNKTENHVYLQKNNRRKALEICAEDYFVRSNYVFPTDSVTIDMTETITNFVKEHYNPIIMLFWYIKNKKILF